MQTRELDEKTLRRRKVSAANISRGKKKLKQKPFCMKESINWNKSNGVKIQPSSIQSSPVTSQQFSSFLNIFSTSSFITIPLPITIFLSSLFPPSFPLHFIYAYKHITPAGLSTCRLAGSKHDAYWRNLWAMVILYNLQIIDPPDTAEIQDWRAVEERRVLFTTCKLRINKLRPVHTP